MLIAKLEATCDSPLQCKPIGLNVDRTVWIIFHEATCYSRHLVLILSTSISEVSKQNSTVQHAYHLFQHRVQNINSEFSDRTFSGEVSAEILYNTSVKAKLQNKTIPSIPPCISSPFPLLFGRQAAFEALSSSLLFHVSQMKAFNVGAKGSI